LLVKQGVLYLNLFLKSKLLSSSQVTRYEHEKPDEERGNIMVNKVYPDRRRRQRLNGQFEISLSHQVKGRTKNVDANGASFEVITDNIDAFCHGTIIPFKIATINMTYDSKLEKLCLSGKGLIIRREVIEETTGCGIKLNLAVLFMQKLNFWVPSNN
jgi:hypothetical protein